MNQDYTGYINIPFSTPDLSEKEFYSQKIDIPKIGTISIHGISQSLLPILQEYNPSQKRFLFFTNKENKLEYSLGIVADLDNIARENEVYSINIFLENLEDTSVPLKCDIKFPLENILFTSQTNINQSAKYSDEYYRHTGYISSWKLNSSEEKDDYKVFIREDNLALINALQFHFYYQ